jgi:hypothetical protein
MAVTIAGGSERRGAAGQRHPRPRLCCWIATLDAHEDRISGGLGRSDPVNIAVLSVEHSMGGGRPVFNLGQRKS